MMAKIKSFYYFLKGKNLYSLGFYEEALSAFQQASKLNPANNVYNYYQKTLEQLNKFQQLSPLHKQLFEQIEDMQQQFKAMQQQISTMENNNNYKLKDTFKNQEKDKNLEKVVGKLGERIATLEQHKPLIPNSMETYNPQYSQQLFSEQFMEMQNQVIRLEDKIEENGKKDQEDRDKLQTSSVQMQGLRVQMNNLENNTSVQVTQLQDIVDENNKKAIHDRNLLRRNTEWLKDHDLILRNAGAIDKAEINKLINDLKSEEPLLYTYYKTFYWTIFNFFHAHLVLSTDLLTYNTEHTMTKKESYAKNTKTTLNGINIVTKHLPVVGSVSEIINDIVNNVYSNNKTKGVKDKTNIITNIINTSFNNLEELENSLVRVSYFITNIRKESILELAKSTENAQVKTNKGLVSKFKSLKKLIDSNLGHDTKSENHQLIKLALQDTVLLIVELYKNHESESKNELNSKHDPQFNEQAKLIFESNYCEESIKNVANSPSLLNDTSIFKIIGNSISFMDSIEQC